MKKNKTGMTIFESLVVIASILMIIAIILPFYSRFREAGKRVSCLNNLRQIGLALKLYENDYWVLPKSKEGVIPWDITLENAGYLAKGEQYLMCETYMKSHSNPSSVNRTYALSRPTFSDAGWTPIYVQTTDVADPYETIMVAEVDNDFEVCEPMGFANADTDRHSNGACYLFFDGHAAWYEEGSLSNDQWGY